MKPLRLVLFLCTLKEPSRSFVGANGRKLEGVQNGVQVLDGGERHRVVFEDVGC